MKITTSVFAALAALSLSAQAATVTVTNLNGATPIPLLGADGANLSGGSYAIGIFSGDAGALGAAGDIAGLKGAFTQFGDAITTNFNGLAGLYQSTVTASVGGSAFSGQNVYTVVGEGSSIGGSNNLFVYDHGFTFVDEPGATPTAVLSGGTSVLGSAGTGNVGGTDFAGFQLAGPGGVTPVIPEPSSALLGLLGLGFLAFRRRK